MKKSNLDVSLEDLDARSVWTATEWESVIFDGCWKDHSHLLTTAFKVPEGILTTMACSICGGHRGRISDYRNLSIEEAVARCEREYRTVLSGFTSWAREHSSCPSNPKTHRLPEEMMESTDRILRLTREDLAGGIPTSPWFVLHGENSEPMVGNIPEAENRRELHVALAGWHTTVRRILNNFVGSPAYAVLVTESWMGEAGEAVPPSESPNRKEVLVVEQMTPNVRRVGVAPIRRDGGTPEDGSGELGELRWSPAPWSRLSLGLFASVGTARGGRQKRQQRGLRF